MGHSGDGTEWNETLPANSEDIEDGANEIRDLRKGANIRASWEHSALAAASVGMIHKTGSAVAYYQATAPTADGKSVALANNNTSNGRIWVDSDDKTLWVWTGSAFEKVMVTRAHLDDDVYQSYAKYHDEQNSGVVAQSLGLGAWTKRRLAEQIDEDNLATITSDAITITTAGEYYIRASAPVYAVKNSKLRWRKTTGTDTTIIVGQNGFSSKNNSGYCIDHLSGKFYSATNSLVYELQHWVDADGTDPPKGGLPVADDGEKEIYATLEIWKVSANTS